MAIVVGGISTGGPPGAPGGGKGKSGGPLSSASTPIAPYFCASLRTFWHCAASAARRSAYGSCAARLAASVKLSPGCPSGSGCRRAAVDVDDVAFLEKSWLKYVVSAAVSPLLLAAIAASKFGEAGRAGGRSSGVGVAATSAAPESGDATGGDFARLLERSRERPRSSSSAAAVLPFLILSFSAFRSPFFAIESRPECPGRGRSSVGEA